MRRPARAMMVAAAVLAALVSHLPSSHLGVVAAAAQDAPAEAPESLFERGNRLYRDGDFGGAAASYGEIVERGFESADLYYNLGNAHFRLGDAARAVLNYERAARLDPGHDDARANLALVNGMLRDQIEPLPRFWALAAFDWWGRLIPRGALAGLVAGLWVALGAGAALLVVGVPGPGRGRAALRRAVLAAVGPTVVLAATLFLRETGAGRPEEAVVMVGEAQALSAPSEEGGLAVFTVHAGTKVRIDRRADGWAEVVLADGKVGWLRLEALGVV